MGWFSDLFSPKKPLALPEPIDLDALALKVSERLKPPPAPPAPPPQALTMKDIPSALLDELAKKASALVKLPDPVKPEPAKLDLDEKTIDMLAARAAALVKVPEAAGLNLLDVPGEMLELIAERSAELKRKIRVSEFPPDVMDQIGSRAAKLVPQQALSAASIPDDVLEAIAARAAKLIPAPAAAPGRALSLADIPSELIEAIAARAAVKVPPAAGGGGGPTSDELVKRVVAQMSKDVIEEIAWEVVPELAELVIAKVVADNKSVAAQLPVLPPLAPPLPPRPRAQVALPPQPSLPPISAEGLPSLAPFTPWKPE